MNDGKNVIRSEIRAVREKHSYFLMSAAGASLAFSATQMNDLGANQGNLFLLLALISWALSFYSGHRFIMLDEGLLWVNHQYLEDLDTPMGKSFGRARMKQVLQLAISPGGRKSERWRRAQMVFLCIGAISFISWKLYACSDCFGLFSEDTVPNL